MLNELTMGASSTPAADIAQTGIPAVSDSVSKLGNLISCIDIPFRWPWILDCPAADLLAANNPKSATVPPALTDMLLGSNPGQDQVESA
jgi:hypothetical protein